MVSNPREGRRSIDRARRSMYLLFNKFDRFSKNKKKESFRHHHIRNEKTRHSQAIHKSLISSNSTNPAIFISSNNRNSLLYINSLPPPPPPPFYIKNERKEGRRRGKFPFDRFVSKNLSPLSSRCEQYRAAFRSRSPITMPRDT